MEEEDYELARQLYDMVTLARKEVDSIDPLAIDLKFRVSKKMRMPLNLAGGVLTVSRLEIKENADNLYETIVALLKGIEHDHQESSLQFAAWPVYAVCSKCSELLGFPRTWKKTRVHAGCEGELVIMYNNGPLENQEEFIDQINQINHIKELK